MCLGGNCPVKEKCHRYTATPSMMQSYIAKPPYIIDKGKFTCDMFWGESAELLFEQLKSIMGHETQKRTNIEKEDSRTGKGTKDETGGSIRSTGGTMRNPKKKKQGDI